jgi:capsular exopolysaccharide synthesis family protein
VPRPRIPAPRRPTPPLDGKLLLSPEVSPGSAEQYRKLALALQQIQDRSAWAAGDAAVERGLKTLLVTSALPGEGKTLTIVNLAVSLSQSCERRVLVIDADLGRPSVHRMLGLSNAVGLGDVLRSSSDRLPIQEVSPLLSVLPAGRFDTNPTAELKSDRMRALLDECASRFDWVLLDAPAVARLPHAHRVTRFARAVLFVIRSGSTPYGVIERAIAELGRGSIIGTVLNGVDPTAQQRHR